MRQIVADRVEQTTAATDLALAALALVYSVELSPRSGWRARVWTAAFACLSSGAGLGAAAHGLQLAERTRLNLWRAIYLSLGLMLVCFGSAATADGWGVRAGKRAMPGLLALALGFFGLSQRRANGFRAFMAFEAACALYALAVYVRLARSERRPGAELTAAGILITIVAAAVQSSSLELELFGLPFDHNGLFHLVQLAGLPLLASGVKAGLNQHTEH